MAYPTISAPYGLKPINLIGGQVFSGSTRSLKIQYGFNTNIFYGDVVGISRGFITRSTVTTGAGATTATGAEAATAGAALTASVANADAATKVAIRVTIDFILNFLRLVQNFICYIYNALALQRVYTL